MATRSQDAPPSEGETPSVSLRQAAPIKETNTSFCETKEGIKTMGQPSDLPLAVELNCIFCESGTSTSIRLLRCKFCDNHFHAHCANMPLPHEDSNVFCRHECYAMFDKQQQTNIPVYKHGDYSRLAKQIQIVLHNNTGKIHVRRQLSLQDAANFGGRGRGRGKGRGRGRGRGRGKSRVAGVKRALQKDTAIESTHRHLRLSSLYKDERESNSDIPTDDPSTPQSTTLPADENLKPAHESHNNNTLRVEVNDRNLQFSTRSASPTMRRPLRTAQDPQFRMTPLVSSSSLSQARIEYSASDESSINGSRIRHGFSSPPYSMAGLQEEPRSLQIMQPFLDNRSSNYLTLTHAGATQRIASGTYSSQQRVRDDRPPYYESTYRVASMRSTPASYDLTSNARNTSAQSSNGASASDYGPSGPVPQTLSQLQPRRTSPNIPWRNPSAFPAEIYERFRCQPDDANHVFRIDLSPVFTDKTTKLYQSEIDFFFRCFESPDVSLVVKGMSNELNQYIWAWPFILECCGSDTHFAFDHFQIKRHAEKEIPELVYVGKLQLSMASFNSYLEKYLSNVPGKDIVVLEDHATKKTFTIVASENIIALNNLVLAKYCAQLYNDLIKGFQWDVFAGGIHCLLQYLPQSSWHEKFASPCLHFNFPGARGSLTDPGNGTTDTAYQAKNMLGDDGVSCDGKVLVGSLELIIFERFEPQFKADFSLILQRAGYDASRKTMLMDAHLHALRSAGFAFSTVLLQDGEFVHVNKGRQHFWRVVEKDGTSRSTNAPCVFLSWEWVYQGVSQLGISTECWFAMKNASLCSDGWVFDLRRAIVEAAKCGVAIVRTGQFLRSAIASGRPRTTQLLSFTAAPAPIDRSVVAQRQAQMILFLESILPCLDAIVEEAYELGTSSTDDSEEFRKVFDDEGMWSTVDADLRDPPADTATNYICGICEREITNLYKQCLGCTVYSRRCRPNMAYQIFRICLRCHSQPERHHFKPRAITSYYDKMLSSEGHTGILPATRRYQSVRSYFKCRCVPSLRCAHCGGCESCSCLCHTLFQTRFRFTAPANLERLRADVDAVVKYHQQQLSQQQQH
ncbi:hypothetical protein CCR75_002329 [Bremia lactucae]|uniref:Zinc finger PHD-type domain-containing protein n=1 Tax=Bremia lactucae TaxID=4779 RepID=A0A976NZB8_BRELC|nr:hypothetical protein CCR75_002329 [Bremia lactucae]